MSKIIFILLILVIFSSTGDLYRVFVDKEFGFFGVRANSTNFTDYSNHTLYIDIGDTVEWENFVITDERVTIVSDNRLWNESDSLLEWNYKIFNYTFTKAGTYRFHIKENEIFRLPEDFNKTKDNETKTNDTLPDWFRFQVSMPTRYQKIVVGQYLSDNSSVVSQKKKNKIVVNTTYNPKVEEEEYDDYNVVPQISTKIENKVSSYQKYTLLELLKSIFSRTQVQINW